MLDKGWKFSTAEECPGAIPDTVNNAQHIRDIYFKVNPDYEGRFTVPVLWDKKLETIVNNESSEIIRMFNTAFNQYLDKEHAERNYYPESLRKEIDENNEWIYDTINNGVYKSGFATTQAACKYTHILRLRLHDIWRIWLKTPFMQMKRTFIPCSSRWIALKRCLRERSSWSKILLLRPISVFSLPLSGMSYKVCGSKHSGSVTYAINTDLIPFTLVISSATLAALSTTIPTFWSGLAVFTKCLVVSWHCFHGNAACTHLLHVVKETVNMDHIKGHYYMSHRQINPTQVVPVGNGPDLDVPVDQ